MKKSSQLAFHAVLLYCFIAGLWVLLSDRCLGLFTTDPALLNRLQTWKGLAFVAMTSVFFYLMLRAQFHSFDREASARRQAEEALQRTARKNASLINNIEGIVWEADAATFQFTFVSGQAERLLGYPTGQWTREKTFWRDHIHPEDRVEAERNCTEQTSRGLPHDLEYRMLAADGRVVWVRDLVNVEMVDGKPASIQGVMVDITERKKLEDEVLLHEQRLNAFFTSAPAGLVILDTELRYIQINDTVAEINGLSVEGHIGKTLQEVVPKLAPVAVPMLRKVLESGEPMLNVEITGETPAQPGVVRHWMESFFPIFGKGARPEGVGAIFVEITGRKLAEAESREGEMRLRNILDSMFVFVGLISLEGVLLEVNRAPVEAAGLTRADVLGKPIVESRWWSHSPQAQALLRDALQRAGRGEVVRGDYEIRIVGEDLICIDATFSPLRNAAGVITSIVGSAVDITARKIAEEELLWKTAFLEAQVDSSLDGILVVDNEGRKILQNQRMNDLWHFPPDVAEHADDTVRVQFVAKQTKDPAAFASKVAHLYAQPDEISRDEIEFLDGAILDRYSSPVRDKAGKYYGRIWTFRDITEQRKLEMQYRHAQKMDAIGQLAGGVAHDFNNILAVIQLQAGLLKDDGNLNPQQLEFAGEIEEAARRAANLTRQLLLFSRQQAMQTADLSLNDLVSNTARMLQRILGEQIQIQLHFDPEPLCIRADPGMIDQILLNLAVNARDAMPGGGSLTIGTSAVEFDSTSVAQTFQARPGPYACITVTDSGAGIPPAVLPRIFEPFFTTKDVGKGTGLGLATVFGIVQQHQGWINVESTPGCGTTFRVYLPRLTTAPPGAPNSRTLLSSIRGGDETILLVEDDPALRTSVKIALAHLGYHVLEASDGAHAFTTWKAHSDEIQLLLTDLVMPGGLTGRELAEQLLQGNPALKVIYSSGYSADLARRDFALEEGVNFLTKPYQAHKLAQTVRDMLDK